MKKIIIPAAITICLSILIFRFGSAIGVEFTINNKVNEITDKEESERILSQTEFDESVGIDVEIKEIKPQANGFDLEYAIKAKENVYVVDYNLIDCENEIRRRLIHNNILNIIFSSEFSLQCSPYTSYYVSPPWKLLLLKKDETANFKVFLSKESFAYFDYAKKMKDVERVKLFFGYIPEKELKKSQEPVEVLDENHIKTRQVEYYLHRYKVLDTDIKWN